MYGCRILVVAAVGLCAVLWTYACGDGATEPPPPDAPRPTTVTVSPATVELTALGATVQLSAEVRDQNGQAMAGATVTWASSAASVATVSATGLVTAVANGTATVTATAGSATGTAAVTVAQEATTAVPSTASFGPAEAGKRAADPIAVTVMDANGLPVAGAAYRWEADENAGWVYPPEGVTDSDGRIKATWVPGFPGTGELVLAVQKGASSLTVELETQSVAPPNPPWGQSTVWLDNTPRGTGYSIELTPLTEPNQSYYAAINWDGAYTGLQRGGHFDRSLIFCMFDPPGGRPTRIIQHAEDAYCTSFDHQGSGKECHLNYPWEVGTTYRFEVTEQETDGGSAMTVHVTNLVTGDRRFVATMLYGARPDLTSFASFVEDFRRTAPTCLAQEVRSTAIRRAMVRINGVWESITRGFFVREDDWGNPDTGPCANAAARDHASGLEIVIGGRTAIDPNISQVTIPR